MGIHKNFSLDLSLKSGCRLSTGRLYVGDYGNSNSAADQDGVPSSLLINCEPRPSSYCAPSLSPFIVFLHHLANNHYHCRQIRCQHFNDRQISLASNIIKLFEHIIIKEVVLLNRQGHVNNKAMGV